ncbi:HEAT repeat domain-containing protein [Luteolibacter sp. Populi]|uniref:HEAT repeat domain-containing protein n=1 Tax=Luteolibacter sp. Populi TaxID=3230487 RepID=UPI0034656034
MKRSLLAILLLVLPLKGQEGDAVQAVLKELKAGKPDASLLEKSVPLLADPAGRNMVRNAILAIDPFPSGSMVELLSNPALAVRLGALELLEEKAGGDFAYNPWLAPGDPENEGASARWKQWAGEKPSTAARKDLLGEEQRRGYLRDLLGTDADKATRARRMLEADGLGAVGFLETFLAGSPALPAGSRSKVREAQYQIVLSRSLGPQAAAMARQLAFGSRDQTLSALGTLRGAGLAALPILRDFIQHPDPLVRETAIDAMLSSGGAQSLAVVGPVLAKEADVNVVHGALRRLKDISGDDSLKIAASFLTHDDEDLLVSAVQACLKLAGGETGQSHFSSGNRAKAPASVVKEAVNEAVLKLLTDPRWRVRTAALEYVTACKVSEAKQRCVELLEDPDEFVRFSAIKAAAAIHAEGAAAKLKEMMMKDPAMTGPVFEGYSALAGAPDEEMLAKLAAYPPDARLAAVRAAETNPELADVVMRFANDPDLDVSCAAIRFLAADENRVKTAKVASVLVAALRSGSPEKRSAVLDRLDLPAASATVDPELSRLLTGLAPGSGEKTTLDPLYDALLKAAGQQEANVPAAPQVAVIPGAQGELLKAIAEVAKGDAPESFRAALCLSKAGDPDGLTVLTGRLPQLSTAQRASIAEQLYSPKRKEALELLRLLLRDPLDEIRTAAAGSAMSAEETPAFVSMVLEELTAPETKLKPHEIYGYQFESAARQSNSSKVVKAWATKIAANDNSSGPLRILALVAMRHGMPAAAVEPTLRLAKSSSDRWVRRAAWHALGTSGTAAFRQNLETLAADPAPQVRTVLADVNSKAESAWHHRFDDTRSIRDTNWFSDRSSRRLSTEAKEWLVKLAAVDPAPEVRFESLLALLSQGQQIDANAFAALIAQQPEESRASHRVADWMGDNVSRLGPGLAPVAAALDTSQVEPEKMHSLAMMLAPKTDGGGFASFAALVAGAAAAEAAPQQKAVEEEPQKVDRESLKIVYFYKPGCAECEKATQLLETVKRDFPLLTVERHNWQDAKEIAYLEALANRFQAPSSPRVAPAIFSQGGYLIKDAIVPQALGKLLVNTMAMPQDDSWIAVAEPEIAKAVEAVEKKYDALTMPIVLGAGLADGVNPCAFATIIFFLSYLQVARRTPREMLAVGFAFILAVFLAYFLAGLALHKILEQVTDKVAGFKKYLDWAFGGLALLAALLSFRDAFKARAGKLDEMTLQLPGFLKDRIRGVIRSGAKARNFVIAAFLAGFFISFLELACTGQVYAPIIYSIQQGKKDAVMWLLAYNLAFILPLVVIFLLTFAGMSNKVLIGFQAKHTFAVKIALGLVFVALAWVILFGSRFLHG